MSITFLDEYRRARPYLSDRCAPCASEAERVERAIREGRSRVAQLLPHLPRHLVICAQIRCENRIRAGQSITDAVNYAIDPHNNPPPDGPRAA